MDGFTFHHTILVVAQVLALVFVLYLFHAAHQARLARKHELSKRILDKLGEQEFVELLRSPDGGRSVERLLGTSRSPQEWVTDAIRRAILLLFAGPAFLAVYALTDFSGREIFLAVGCVSVAVGVGYLVAAALTRARARREDADPAA